MLLAPVMSKLLRFFPPVVTGTIIAIIGISLMRVGVGWAMGGPAPLAQSVDVPKLVAMVDGAKATAAAAAASAAPGASRRCSSWPGRSPWSTTPTTARWTTWPWPAFVLVVGPAAGALRKGFISNISVLLGIVAGCVVAAAMGKMGFDKVAKAHWFDVVTPFAFGMPTFDP
jgi:xanthine/uracil permease